MSRNFYAFLGSFSTPGGGEVVRERPRVNIIVPDVSLAPTQLKWSIIFLWDLEVEDFTIDDISLSGDMTGVSLGNFQGSGKRFSVDITLPNNANGVVSISVAANAANEVDHEDNTGPDRSTGEAIPYNTSPRAPQQSILCRRERTDTALDDLNSLIPLIGGIEGGVYRGIFSAAKLGNFIYFVSQIQRIGPAYIRGGGKPAVGRSSPRGRLADAGGELPIENNIRFIRQDPDPFLGPPGEDESNRSRLH